MKKFKLIAASLFAISMALAGCDGGGCKEHVDEDKNHICDVCGQTISECVDENKDHKCDYCKKSLGDHIDEDGDYLCDICEEQLPQVTGVSIVNVPESIMRTKTATLKANVSVKGGASKDVTWSVSNDNAEVSSKGVVTGLKVGTVSVTATSKADPSKSATVEIEIIELYWTEEELAIMSELLPEPIPFIEGSWEFDDSNLEMYGLLVLSCESKDAIVDVREAFDNDSKFNYLGTSYDEEYECDDYYYSRPSVDCLGYETYIDTYVLESKTFIAVYFSYIEYDAWPADEIESYLTLIGFEDAEVKEFEFAEGGIAVAAPEEFDGEPIVYIGVYDGECSVGDYVALYDELEYQIVNYDDVEFVVSPKDKSYSMYIYGEDGAFEIMVMSYIPDYRLGTSFESEFIATGGTQTISVEKIGSDVPEDAIISFESSDETIATVSADGVVTAVKAGKVAIIVSYENFETVLIFYVKDTIAGAYTEAQLNVFKNVHDASGVVVPFTPHFNSVEWDEETKCVSIVGDEVGLEALLKYRSALLEDGWVDLLEEQGIYEFYMELIAAFGMEVTIDEVVEMMALQGPITFEKEVVVSDTEKYYVTAELYLDLDPEDEEDEEGALCVDVYDMYLYSYADAKSLVEEYLEGYKVESTATLPETAIPATHYYVLDDTEEGCVEFVAYDSTVTLEQVKTVLEECGFELVKKDVEGNPEYDIEGYSYLIGTSKDGVLDIQVYEEDGDIEIMVGPHVVEGATFNYSELTSPVSTIGDYKVDVHKTGGEATPVVQNNEELRVYSGNEMVISSEGEPITSIDFYTCDCTNKVGATFEAKSGTLTETDYGYHWEGNATSVTFTCTKVDDNHKQTHFFSIDVNGGGEGGGDIDIDIDVEKALADI